LSPPFYFLPYPFQQPLRLFATQEFASFIANPSIPSLNAGPLDHHPSPDLSGTPPPPPLFCMKPFVMLKRSSRSVNSCNSVSQLLSVFFQNTSCHCRASVFNSRLLDSKIRLPSKAFAPFYLFFKQYHVRISMLPTCLGFSAPSPFRRLRSDF